MRLPLTPPRPAADLVRPTTAGEVRGARRGGLRTWRGIPYAAPPVGPLRFRAPQPPVPWSGVRDAVHHGPVPPQQRQLATLGAGRFTRMSEDCLTLGVTAPDDDGPARPVVVWVYGGANTIGASSASSYDGAGLVRAADVVHVSFNYRIGALGYLDFTAFSGEHATFESNLGLRDQVAALAWVRDNVAAFGGDPERVTVFGESAGGTAVTTLLATPSARGLFSGAIAESPAPGAVFSAERAAGWGRTFVELLGADVADGELALATAPTDVLVRTATRFFTQGPRVDEGTTSFSPVVDGDLLPAHPVDAARAGGTHPVPLVIGTNDREGAFFPRVMDILPTSEERIRALFDGTDPEARERVVAAYPGYPGKRACEDIGGDYAFWHPSILVAEGHSQVAPTWFYRYDFATRANRVAGLDATHGTELAAVFGTLNAPLALLQTSMGGRGDLRRVSTRVQARWAAFAHDRDPGAGWPRYTDPGRATYVFDRDDHVEDDPRAERRRAWESYQGYR
ncbi:carboxylesterase/lipase family protein [Rhodococcus aerolatus]